MLPDPRLAVVGEIVIATPPLVELEAIVICARNQVTDPAASRPTILARKRPATLGIPATAPVVEFKDSPLGSDPSEIEKL
jgi:hypothetical protein